MGPDAMIFVSDTPFFLAMSTDRWAWESGGAEQAVESVGLGGCGSKAYIKQWVLSHGFCHPV